MDPTWKGSVPEGQLTGPGTRERAVLARAASPVRRGPYPLSWVGCRPWFPLRRP